MRYGLFIRSHVLLLRREEPHRRQASLSHRTLRRVQGMAVAHLKTGSLRDVAGVAGFVHGASGRRYVLVAIANHPNAGAIRSLFEPLMAWAARDN